MQLAALGRQAVAEVPGKAVELPGHRVERGFAGEPTLTPSRSSFHQAAWKRACALMMAAD